MKHAYKYTNKRKHTITYVHIYAVLYAQKKCFFLQQQYSLIRKLYKVEYLQLSLLGD